MEGDEALSVENLPFDGLVGEVGFPVLELLGEVGRVFFAAAGVGDDVEFTWETGDDGVVYDAAGFAVEKSGKGRVVFLEGGQGRWGDALEEGLGAGA